MKPKKSFLKSRRKSREQIAHIVRKYEEEAKMKLKEKLISSLLKLLLVLQVNCS